MKNPVRNSRPGGPNIPQMMGATGAPKSSPGGKIEPLERHGVKLISIQFFVPEGQPIVWRGPLIGGAIQQFLRDVEWGELDYLVVDLPPGTSDAQLTLAQAVPLAGSVLVTTPQDVALSDVAKALSMFRRMNVPILGIVENMSSFACPHCGELTEIFGRGGAERLAKDEGLDHLGRIPLELAVRQGGDGDSGRRRYGAGKHQHRRGRQAIEPGRTDRAYRESRRRHAEHQRQRRARDAEFLLERSDHAADGGLGRVQRRGRAREVEVALGQFAQGAQLLKGHMT